MDGWIDRGTKKGHSGFLGLRVRLAEAWADSGVPPELPELPMQAPALLSEAASSPAPSNVPP